MLEDDLSFFLVHDIDWILCYSKKTEKKVTKIVILVY